MPRPERTPLTRTALLKDAVVLLFMFIMCFRTSVDSSDPLWLFLRLVIVSVLWAHALSSSAIVQCLFVHDEDDDEKAEPLVAAVAGGGAAVVESSHDDHNNNKHEELRPDSGTTEEPPSLKRASRSNESIESIPRLERCSGGLLMFMMDD